MWSQDRAGKQELRAMYEAAIAFREAEPWRRLYDADLIAVENPADGTIGYCSVMGRMGQHYGFCVFLGAGGLAGFFRLLELGDDEDGFADAAFAQDYIMCSFEDRDQLDGEDLQEIASLGLTFHGRHAWPQFRRYEPGYPPWYLDRADVLFITHALRQVLVVLEQMQVGEAEVDFDLGRTVLRQSERRDGQLVWHTKPWELSKPVVVYEPLEIESELILWQVRKAPRSLRAVWEVDLRYLPVVVQEDQAERPRFPRGFLLADHTTGMILDCHAYEDPSEDAHQVIARLTQHITNYGLPKEIRVKSELLEALLADFCSKAGLNLKRASSLPKVEYFLGELEQGF